MGDRPTGEVSETGESAPVDPALYWRDDLRAVLARHNFGALYRVLIEERGLSQRRIAGLTGQSQSEVSEILAGRTVRTYAVLVRIVDGLGIPAELVGLSWRGPDGASAYPDPVRVVEPEEAEKMLRRHLLAQGGIAITGAVVTKLGGLLAELPGPPPVPLPTRLGQVHVSQVQDLTRRLGVGETFCDPQMCSAAVAWATRLLEVPGTDAVHRALRVALAELHSEAAWAAFDAGLYGRTLHHHAHSMELATEAGDTYLTALALTYAGDATVSQGHPDDGLKMLQCAQVSAWDIPAGEHRAVVVGETGNAAVEATALEASSTAHVALGDLTSAHTALMRGRDLWTPDPADPFGDMDRPAARLELARGRLDRAAQFAAASARRWAHGRQLSRTQTGIVTATIHVSAGDSRGLQLAHDTLTEVRKLSSARVRTQLLPLADALATRPGADARDLARQARQVATTTV